MDPEFKRILLRVMMLGGAILAIGAGALVIAFRAYAHSQEEGREFRATILIAGVLFFVFVACVLLLRISFLR